MRVVQLKKRAEFVKMTQHGRRYVTPSFVLQMMPREKDEVAIGYTASKKVGGAVQRNRAKRRLRGLFDQTIRLNPDFQYKGEGKGVTMVLIARRAILDKPFAKIKADFENILRELSCDV
tara:strand:+ start:31 stop:387 length:357 start_codon:yes stop_codon:yes gene_type:complete